MDEKNERLLTLRQVSERYGFSLLTLQRYASERRFPMLKLYGRIWVDPQQFEKWLDTFRIPPKKSV